MLTMIVSARLVDIRVYCMMSGTCGGPYMCCCTEGNSTLHGVVILVVVCNNVSLHIQCACFPGQTVGSAWSLQVGRMYLGS